MRILHVITSLDTGGAERLMVDMLPLLQQIDGIDVELLLFNGVETPFKKELICKGVKIYQLNEVADLQNRWCIYNPLNICKLRKFIKQYDIVHTHNTACQYYVPIAKCLFGTSAILVTTEHSSTNRRRTKQWLRTAEKWMYRQYAKIICISDQTRDNLDRYLGESHSSTTIYNGVDISRFLGPVKDISGQNQFVITMVSAFREQKDHETLLKAMTLLPNNYHLQLVGRGRTEQKTKEQCNELGLSNVSFMGMRSDVVDILNGTDVIVLSSHWEGLSLSSIEGMASGRPFVASDVDGLREIVSGAGVLFPHGDEKALASAIRELCENPTYYKQVAQSCQERAKNYDITKMAQAYYELYESLL